MRMIWLALCAATTTAAADDVKVLRGTGRVRVATVETDNDLVVVLRTAAGPSRHVVSEARASAHMIVEVVRWQDVIGDSERELWIELSSVYAPCGACDDGPTLTDSFVVVCRASVEETACSPPLLRGQSNDVAPSAWRADVAVLRSGAVELRNVTSNNISRSNLRRLTRSRPLFPVTPRG